MKTLLIAVLALAAGPLAAADDFPDIGYEALSEAIAAGTVTLVDANGTASYTTAHIPGAHDFEALKGEGFAGVLPAEKDGLIVAYCGGPGCKAYLGAARAAAALGYTEVRHFSGGIRGWLERHPPAAEEPTAAAPTTEASTPVKAKSGCCGAAH